MANIEYSTNSTGGRRDGCAAPLQPTTPIMSNSKKGIFNFARPSMKKKKSIKLEDLNRSEMNKSTTSNGRKSI